MQIKVGRAPKDCRVVVDGVDVSSCVSRLAVHWDANQVTRAVIEVYAEIVEVDLPDVEHGVTFVDANARHARTTFERDES